MPYDHRPALHSSTLGIRQMFVLLALILMGRTAAQERVVYVCSGYPLQPDKNLVVTARGSDGSTEAAKVDKPGGRYYLAMLKLRTGVAYDVEYELGGRVVHVHSLDPVRASAPQRPIVKEIQFDKVPKMKDGPNGMVPLTARVEGVSASTTGDPVFTAASSDGGSTVKTSKAMAKGHAFVHVKPGFTYALQYRIGGKVYGRTAKVPDDGTVPNWVLVAQTAPEPEPVPVPDPPCVPGKPCDDGDPTTKKDKVLEDCSCRGTPEECTPGSPCDDGNPETVGEKFNRRCECTGGVQKPDCKGVPGGPDMPGETCDDENAQTVNDVWDANCKCAGTSLEKDCLGVVGGTATKGAPCDDGDATTVEDKYDGTCKCRGFKARASLPLIKAVRSETERCSNLHVLASAKPRSEWIVNDVDEVKVKVDPSQYAGAKGTQQGTVEKGGGLQGLIYVHDSLRLKLFSPDECFEITDDNHDQSISSTDTLVFSWSIKAVKVPSQVKDDRTTLEVRSYTLDCNTGKWTTNPTNTLVFEVTVTEPFDLIKWLQDHIAAIGGILGGIAVILGYFKDWFGKLFKKKEKEAEA